MVGCITIPLTQSIELGLASSATLKIGKLATRSKSDLEIRN
jgi:hypothetical protein